VTKALSIQEVDRSERAQLTRRIGVCKPVWVTTNDVEVALGRGFRRAPVVVPDAVPSTDVARSKP
jgi:hypothetical protein